MEYLKAEQQPTQYHFEVWLDTTKTLENKITPDPAYVREYDWGITPPEGQNATQYLANIKNEIALLVQDELNNMKVLSQPAIALAGF